MAAIAKNGPYGISCVFFIFNMIKDTGKAINAEKNTTIIEFGNPKTNPNIPSSFISPPPIQSFLNKKSPNNFNNSIKINAPKPFTNEIPTDSTPLIYNLTNISKSKQTINTLSGIIIV